VRGLVDRVRDAGWDTVREIVDYENGLRTVTFTGRGLSWE
jgi:hypothetical protein